jgi:hypothetical protein
MKKAILPLVTLLAITSAGTLATMIFLVVFYPRHLESKAELGMPLSQIEMLLANYTRFLQSNGKVIVGLLLLITSVLTAWAIMLRLSTPERPDQQ